MIRESIKELITENRMLFPVAMGCGLALGSILTALLGAVLRQSLLPIALIVAVAVVAALWLPVFQRHAIEYLDQVAPLGLVVAGALGILGSIVPSPAKWTLCIVFFILSLGFLAFESRRTTACEEAGECAEHESEAKPASVNGVLTKPLAYLLSYATVYGVTLGLVYAAQVSWTATALSGWGLGSGFVVAGVAVWGFRLFGTAARGLDVITRVSLVAIVAGLLFLIQPGLPEASLFVLAFGIALFLYLLARMTLDLSETFALPRWTNIGVAALFLCFFALGTCIGWLLMRAGLIGGDLSGLTIGSMLAIVIVTVYGLSSDRCWTAHDLRGVGSVAERSEYGGGAWRSACDSVAEQYGLTRREREVFSLLAKGRNAAAIEKALVISNHTVKSHMLNIYRKLDIHSHQELIDIIEEKRERIDE